MNLIVMKFGGNTLASVEQLREAADRIISEQAAGHQVLIVVSAMGKVAETLTAISGQLSEHAGKREMDQLLSAAAQSTGALLAMELQARGHEAVSYTGWQAGIRTDERYGHASMTSVDTSCIRPVFQKNAIIIVAGGQGVTKHGDITMLGSGGSDISAVALAASFGARQCVIYTDAAGICTADPHIVRQARKLKEISYDEMLELTYLGSGGMHPRAVEYAKNSHVELVIRSSFADKEGTLIKEEASMENTKSVRGLAFEKNVTKVTLRGLPNDMAAVSRVFDALAAQNVNVDIIVQNVLDEAKTNVSFTCDHDVLGDVLAVLHAGKKELGYREIVHVSGLAKVSIVGSGMASNPGVAAQMFHELADKKIKIKMISTSEIKISTIIDEERMAAALVALHEAFRLDDEGRAD